jgi:hypothetical protein
MYTVRYPGANSTMVDFGDIAFNTSSLASYVYSLPNEVARGDVFAIVIFLILLYAGIIIVQKLTTVLVLVLKKVFLLIIVSLAFFEFMRMFALKLSLEGLSTRTIVFGAAGFAMGVVAFSIALYVAFRSLIVLQKSEQRPAEVSEGETLPGIQEPGDAWEPQHETESNNRAGLLSPRLLRTGLETFASSGSSHYYPFGCQFRTGFWVLVRFFLWNSVRFHCSK